MTFLFVQAISNIRRELGDHAVWIAVDETTNARGEGVANMVVGRLDGITPGIPHLVSSRILEKTNHGTIARFVRDSLGNISNYIPYFIFRIHFLN